MHYVICSHTPVCVDRLIGHYNVCFLVFRSLQISLGVVWCSTRSEECMDNVVIMAEAKIEIGPCITNTSLPVMTKPVDTISMLWPIIYVQCSHMKIIAIYMSDIRSQAHPRTLRQAPTSQAGLGLSSAVSRHHSREYKASNYTLHWSIGEMINVQGIIIIILTNIIIKPS